METIDSLAAGLARKEGYACLKRLLEISTACRVYPYLTPLCPCWMTKFFCPDARAAADCGKRALGHAKQGGRGTRQMPCPYPGCKAKCVAAVHSGAAWGGEGKACTCTPHPRGAARRGYEHLQRQHAAAGTKRHRSRTCTNRKIKTARRPSPRGGLLFRALR